MVRRLEEMETIKMGRDIPAWAKKRVLPDDSDFFRVRRLHRRGRTQIQLPNLKELKGWAKSHGWPTPMFGFKEAFITRLFESNETLSLALNESGINIHMPIKEHILSNSRS